MTQANESPGGALPPIDRSIITVVHCDPFTGIVLDPNGTWTPARNPCPTFATVEEAKDYCRDIVLRYPHLECHVTGPGLPLWRYRDENWIRQESEARQARVEAYHREECLANFLIAFAKFALALVAGALLGLCLDWLLKG